jgi:hypothetical protein
METTAPKQTILEAIGQRALLLPEQVHEAL